MHAAEANAAFVASMEDVLEVYQRPHADPDRPVVCWTTTKQLIQGTRVLQSRQGQASQPATTTSMSAMVLPMLHAVRCHLQGWRHVEVTDHHAALDYAQPSRRCRTDTSSTPARSCWCRTISARTSRRHSMKPSPPPRHRSRQAVRMALHTQARQLADMAETELSVLSRQCLDRRIPTSRR